MAESKIVLKKKPTKSVAKKNQDPTILCYRVLLPITVADENGVAHRREFGDYVPEAAQWKNIGTYLKSNTIEKCYINTSELKRWREEFAERWAEQDAAAEQAKADAARAEELRRELAELEGRQVLEARAQQNVPQGNRLDFLEGEQASVQQIDFGGVKMNGGGAPHPVALPRANTREVPQQPNVAENRTRTTTVRMRKKG